jgi:hypothetical protein
MPHESCWIKYQLNLRNIKLKAVAQKANCTTSMVSQVICEVKKSEKVEKALADVLGFASFYDLMVAAIEDELS